MDLLQQIDQLTDAQDYEGAQIVLNSHSIEGPEMLWRAAANCYDLAENRLDVQTEARKSLLSTGLDYARKGLTFAPVEQGQCEKWCAILLGKYSESLPSKEKIANAFLIRGHALRAAELLPEDANVQHLLGRWCHSVASIGWTERQVAALLFAEPPTSTFQEALYYLLRAQTLYGAASSHRNQIALGDVYLAMGQREHARKWFQLAALQPKQRPVDQALIEQASEKLSRINSSWF